MVKIVAASGERMLNGGDAASRQQLKEEEEKQFKANGKLTASDGGDTLDDGPNQVLVEEVRQMLRQHYEANLEECERVYSKPHYEHIMDSKSAYTCWRYLLHCDKEPEAAVELIKSTLIWRQENNVDALCANNMIKDFWLRAPIGFTGQTLDGTDILYAIGKNYRKPSALIKQTIRDFIAFTIFDWDRRHQNDLDQLVLVFDVTDTGLRNIDLEFSSWLVSIRDYLPARIKAIYFVGIPFIIRPIIKLILSWLPERFKRIAHCGTWNELVVANIHPTSLPEEVGGQADNSWRLAPLESRWAHEIEGDKAEEIFRKICEACSFNVSEEQLKRLYRMQVDYENKQAKNVK